MPDAQSLRDRTYSEDILERAAQRIEWHGMNETDIASAEALVSIGQTLKLLIQPDPATRETFICFDCGKTAGPSCGYFGHGVTELGDLMDSYDGSSVVEAHKATKALNQAQDKAKAELAKLAQIEYPTEYAQGQIVAWRDVLDQLEAVSR